MYYLIVGATCAGKDKIANYITEELEDFKTIISTTSRPIRPGEIDGVEYHFVSNDEFQTMMHNDEFIEYRVYNTVVNGIKDIWYYGLEKKNVADTHTDYVVVMDYQGAVEFMEYFGRETTILIYVKSLYSERYVRNILRHDFSLPEWLRRNKDDAGWLSKAEAEADVVIYNRGFDYPENPIDQKLEVDIKEDMHQFETKFDKTKRDIRHMLNMVEEFGIK